MRTRRSWKNQDRLFRELFKPKPAVPKSSGNFSKRCWDCFRYPKGGRDRGHCALRDEMVNGNTADRACFEERRK